MLYCFTFVLRLGSHLRQNLDKFVLITKKSVKFLSSVDHAKCDLLVSTRTKTCPRRQIFKGAIFLPRSTTFCEQKQKIVFLVINLSVNSVNLIFFRFTFHFSLRRSYRSRQNNESRIWKQFSRFLGHPIRSNDKPK